MKVDREIIELEESDQIFAVEHEPTGTSLGGWKSSEEEVKAATKGFKAIRVNGVTVYDKSKETVIVDCADKNVILFASLKGQRVKIIADNRPGMSLKNKVIKFVDKAGNLLGISKPED